MKIENIRTVITTSPLKREVGEVNPYETENNRTEVGLMRLTRDCFGHNRMLVVTNRPSENQVKFNRRHR